MTGTKRNGDDLYAKLWAMQSVLQRATAGDFGARCSVSMTDVSGRDPLAMIAPSINLLLAEVEHRGLELDERQLEQGRQQERLLEQERDLDDKAETIAKQTDAIRELSTPVLDLWDEVLVLPIIGAVDTRRGQQMQERLLEAVSQSQARFVILDITGVEVVDTATADHFLKIVGATELLGARCILTGIRPSVAQTLVRVGVDLSRLSTYGSLKQGLRFCLSRNKETR